MARRNWLSPLLLGGAFVAIFVAETRRPLRRQRESRPLRTARNLSMAGLTAATMLAIQAPLLKPVVRRVAENRLGLLQRLDLPPTLSTILGVLLLDYTLWWWHWMNHRVPFLWRFHLVHHIDRDLDASTAIRFHFGEMSLSVFYRMAQIRLLGTSRQALSVWQFLLMLSIFFHHSNIRLSRAGERSLARFLVTPSMHGIHHSNLRDETDSNWSSLFPWWDSLHGTLQMDVPQEAITIGVPAYQEEASVTLPKIVMLPLLPSAPQW